MKTKVLTNVKTAQHQTTITSPMSFRNAVTASRHGGYNERYASQTAVGDIWQGWKLDAAGKEIVVTHMQVTR